MQLDEKKTFAAENETIKCRLKDGHMQAQTHIINCSLGYIYTHYTETFYNINVVFTIIFFIV